MLLFNKPLTLNSQNWEAKPFRFFQEGEIYPINGAVKPGYKNVIIKGANTVTLYNAKLNGLNYVKLYGACEQTLLPDTYQLYTSVTADGVTYEYSSQNLTQIPCKRIADNVFGLYNYTTKVFTSEV